MQGDIYLPESMIFPRPFS